MALRGLGSPKRVERVMSERAAILLWGGREGVGNLARNFRYFLFAYTV